MERKPEPEEQPAPPIPGSGCKSQHEPGNAVAHEHRDVPERIGIGPALRRMPVMSTVVPGLPVRRSDAVGEHAQPAQPVLNVPVLDDCPVQNLVREIHQATEAVPDDRRQQEPPTPMNLGGKERR